MECKRSHLYTFRINLKGNLIYGTETIGPKAERPIRTWGELLDFITLYIICRNIHIQVGEVDSFVFDGKPPSIKIIPRYFPTIVNLARKYNDSIKLRRETEKIFLKILMEFLDGMASFEEYDSDLFIVSLLWILKESDQVDLVMDRLSEYAEKHPSVLDPLEESNPQLYNKVLNELGWDKWDQIY